MLLGVVEENRKKEVRDNLGVCAQLVENIKKQLAEIEGKPTFAWKRRRRKNQQQQNSRALATVSICPMTCFELSQPIRGVE